jgi:Pathogenicity locus
MAALPALAPARARSRTSSGAPAGPPRKALPKARHAGECVELEQLPNIGPALAQDLRRIGIAAPSALRDADGYQLYRRLCEATGARQDPCVLDTFLAITDFMRGAAPAPWWHYTADRKLRYRDL